MGDTMPHLFLSPFVGGSRRVSVGIAATVLAILAVTFAWSASFAAPSSRTATLTIPWKVRFLAHQSAPPAYSWGDTLQATYTFTGGKAGTADFVCTVVADHFLCQGIIRLPEGDIYTMTGPVDPKQPAAVVGGTRAFVGVTGQFTQQENPDDTGTWSIELLPRRQGDR
jgi:hypothetical protein